MDTDQEPDGPGVLRLDLLGGMRITLGGAPVRGFLSAKVQALLCYLAVTGRAHARESLMALLWGELPEERAAHGLRQALSNLQKLAGPHLTITRPTVAFNPAAPYALDTEEFLTLVQQAEESAMGAQRRLRQAVALYTGDFLDGFTLRDAPDFDEWAAAQRELLRHWALDALHRLAAYHTARGEYLAAADYLRRLLSLDPWREDAHRQLMLLLAYQGRPDAALAQYQTVRRVLAAEFGDDPAPETVDLLRRIRAGGIAPPRPVPPGNLPAALEPLIGRGADAAQVAALLEDPATRLLTLTGPGGVGKTRLALQVAADLAGDFAQGVFFVPLAALRDPALVLRTIATTLGVEPAGERPVAQSLASVLRDQQMLLVLDNFEHLAASAPAMAELIAMLPRLRVLVTSQARLRVRGERVYEVAPLAVPPLPDPVLAEDVARFPAAALFVDRARAARPDFALTDANARVVAEICRALDGLPLALELAAARLTILPAPALLARLGDRLGVLTGGPRDLPERQQTVRATIAWSTSLLAPPEQTLFAQLAVFAGGATLAAIEAVCPDDPQPPTPNPQPPSAVLDALTALVHSSLVRREQPDGGDERFSMLELVREYAWTCLDDGAAAALRGRHAEYYLSLAEAARPDLIGPRQSAWLARFEVEYGNLRAALAWATAPASEAGLVALALSASTPLLRFWQSRGYVGEGRQWLAGLLDRPDPVSPGVRAEALRNAGALAFAEGALIDAVQLGEAGLALYEQIDDDALGRATLLNNLGNAKRDLGAFAEATALYEQALAIFRRLDDTRGIAVISNNLGTTAHRQGDPARALALYEESLAIRRAVGDTLGIAYTLYKLAEAARDQGAFAQAEAACAESLAVSQRAGDKNGMAMAVLTQGTVRQAQGDVAAAASLYAESLVLFTALTDRWGLATAKHRQGTLVQEQGDAAQARRLYEESLALFEENGDCRAAAAVQADLEGLAD